jgi:S-adenosylmethionine-dependent methyltransferase
MGSHLLIHPQQGYFLLDDTPLSAGPAESDGPAGPATFDHIGDAFIEYYRSARGVVRREVLRANLGPFLPPSEKLKVLDVGCGDGQDAIWLARCGYDVTAIDPSRRMLKAAADRLTNLRPRLRNRVRLRLADEREAASVLRGAAFDVILCHGVIMYQDDDDGFVGRISSLLRPGGLLSILTKNAGALAYRSAARSDFAEAQRLLISNGFSTGRLGVTTRGHKISDLLALLGRHDLVTEQWFGIRVFSDAMESPASMDHLQELCALESMASSVDPYRGCARLLQAIARKT